MLTRGRSTKVTKCDFAWLVSREEWRPCRAARGFTLGNETTTLEIVKSQNQNALYSFVQALFKVCCNFTNLTLACAIYALEYNRILMLNADGSIADSTDFGPELD